MASHNSTLLRVQLAEIAQGERLTLDLSTASGIGNLTEGDFRLLERASTSGALSRVEALSLRESLVKTHWLDPLLSLLGNCPRLGRIDAFRWEMGPDGLRRICHAAQRGTLRELRELDLGWAGVADAGISTLMDAYEFFPKLEQLRFEWEGFSHDSVVRLGKNLQRFSSLRSLALRNVGLEPDSLRAMCVAWSEPHPTLTSLDLSRNELGGRGARLLGSWLPQIGQSLRSLRLYNTRIDTEGALALSTVWGRGQMSNLSLLDLSANWFDDPGVMAWATGLSQGGVEHLTNFYCSNNKIGSTAFRALHDSLTAASNLLELDLSDNAIGPPGVHLLATAAEHWPKLTTLRVDRNGLDALSMLPLLRALCRDPWASSLRVFSGRQLQLDSVPREVSNSDDASIWRTYALQLPATPIHLRDALSGDARRGKRVTAELSKCLLALVNTCLEWPDDTVSIRRIQQSALLHSHRRQLGLSEETQGTTVHNHLVYLAKRCGMTSLIEVSKNRQSARFTPSAPARLARLKALLGEEIRDAERRSLSRE